MGNFNSKLSTHEILESDPWPLNPQLCVQTYDLIDSPKIRHSELVDLTSAQPKVLYIVDRKVECGLQLLFKHRLRSNFEISDYEKVSFATGMISSWNMKPTMEIHNLTIEPLATVAGVERSSDYIYLSQILGVTLVWKIHPNPKTGIFTYTCFNEMDVPIAKYVGVYGAIQDKITIDAAIAEDQKAMDEFVVVAITLAVREKAREHDASAAAAAAGEV